jgi:hypothetical protein
LIGSRVETNRMLSSYVSTAFNLYRPAITMRAATHPMRISTSAMKGEKRVVALQVEFERQILKPVFHLIGFRLWV